MRYLDKNELKDLKVVATSLLGPEWTLQPAGGDGLLAGVTQTQRGETFQLIIQCTQGSNSAQIILVDYNKFLRENAETLNTTTAEGKIKIQPENREIKVSRSSADRLAGIVASLDDSIGFVFSIGRDRILRFWHGSSVIFTVPTGNLASEIAQGVEFPIANSGEMIRLVLRNCSKAQ